MVTMKSKTKTIFKKIMGSSLNNKSKQRFFEKLDEFSPVRLGVDQSNYIQQIKY